MNPVNMNISNAMPQAMLDMRSATPQKSENGGAFKNMLVESIQEVNGLQKDADHLVERMAAGEDVNTTEVLTAVQKADIAFRMMMQMRNKLVEAYQEVQNIRV